MYDIMFNAFLDILPNEGEYKENILTNKDDKSIPEDVQRHIKGSLIFIENNINFWTRNFEEVNLLFLVDEDIKDGEIIDKQISIICIKDLDEIPSIEQHYFINDVDDFKSSLIITHFEKYLKTSAFNEELECKINYILKLVNHRMEVLNFVDELNKFLPINNIVKLNKF